MKIYIAKNRYSRGCSMAVIVANSKEEAVKVSRDINNFSTDEVKESTTLKYTGKKKEAHVVEKIEFCEGMVYFD